MSKLDDLKKRLIKRIWKKSDSGCWLIWDKNKYSSFSFKGKSISVHHASYIIFKGKVLKKKIVVCHKCNNRACINPEHLYSGTYRSNSLDCVRSGNHFNKSKTECPKGHKYTGNNLC